MPDLIQKIALSRYATKLLAAHPELAAELAPAQPFSRAEIDRALLDADGDDEAGIKQRLRRLRSRVMLRVMARDLDGTADLTEVCGTMSALADAQIGTALAWSERLHGARHGAPRTAS